MRLLSLYERLRQGAVIDKKQEAQTFGVTEKTIQRDLEDLRAYIAEHHSTDGSLTLIYDRRKKGYVLNRDERVWLTNQEILAISKILLESRAITCEELNRVLDKLIMQCIPEERKHVKEVILSERYHYISPRHAKPLFRKLWDFSYAVRRKNLAEIEYLRARETEPITRTVEPVGVIFSEYYFYLIAYIKGAGHEFPAVYRLDRITRYTISTQTFFVPYARRFEEGEFRKRVQFMRAGKIIRLRFRFWGPSLEAVLDRLPTARVIKSEDARTDIVEAEVFGKGIIMWLLSQAEFLEVLSPESLREQLKAILKEMAGLYSSK